MARLEAYKAVANAARGGEMDFAYKVHTYYTVNYPSRLPYITETIIVQRYS